MYSPSASAYVTSAVRPGLAEIAASSSSRACLVVGAGGDERIAVRIDAGGDGEAFVVVEDGARRRPVHLDDRDRRDLQHLVHLVPDHPWCVDAAGDDEVGLQRGQRLEVHAVPAVAGGLHGIDVDAPGRRLRVCRRRSAAGRTRRSDAVRSPTAPPPSRRRRRSAAEARRARPSRRGRR